MLQADKIEKLEKDHGWHEEEFDFILQFMRTILLKREFLFSPFVRPIFSSDSLIAGRWRITYLYYTFSGQLASELITFVARYTLAPKETVPQAQRD